MKARSVFRSSSLLLGGLLVAGLAAPAWAQSSSGAQGLLDDKWVFNLGAFVFGSDLKANLNGQSTTNPEVDFDEVFGKTGDASRVRADVLWRITPVHRMRFMYFDNSNSRSKVLANDVKWGDYTFNAGSRADFKQSLRVYELAYEYAFVRRPTYEVAASVGAHVMDMKLELSGMATGTGPNCTAPPCTATAAIRSNALIAPLPLIGLRAGWVVAPDWYIDVQGQYFKVKVGEYDGNWSDLRVGATWMFNRNFGLGLGYNRFVTTVGVSKVDFDGRLKLGYGGLQAYLSGTF